MTISKQEGPDDNQLRNTGLGLGIFTGIWIITFGIITVIF